VTKPSCRKDAYRTAEDVDDAARALQEAVADRNKALVEKIVSAIAIADLLAGGVRFSPSWVADYKRKREKSDALDRNVFTKMNTYKRVSQKFHRAGVDGFVEDADAEED